MRKLIFIIVLIIPTQFFGQISFITWLETAFYSPYIQAGDSHCNNGNYDSALFMYSIPYQLITGDLPKNVETIDKAKNLTGLIKCQWWILNLKLGKVYYYLGEYNSSMNFLLTVKEQSGCDLTNSLEGKRNYFLGLVLSKLYDYEKSLLYYFNSLNYYKNRDNDSSYIIGLIYCDIGNVYYNLGSYDKAVEYYHTSKRILNDQESPNYSKISIIINNIGSIYYRLGDYSSAIEYYKKAVTMQHVSNVNYFDLSMYLNNIAGIYLIINKTDSAEKYYYKSLQIRTSNLNNNNLLVQSYNQLGLLNIINANYHKSLKQFQEAIVLNTIDFADPSIFSNPSLSDIIDYRLLGISLYYKAIVLHKLFLSENKTDLGYLLASYSTFNLLLMYFKYIYVNQVNERNYEYFVAFNREVLNAVIDIFYNEQDLTNNQYLSLIQRGKSIYLYQSLIESRAKEFTNVPKHLILKENEIRREISQNNHSIQIAQNESVDLNNSEEFALLVTNRNNSTRILDSLISVFEHKYPNYFQLKYDFTSIPLDSIQAELAENEAIIEYYFSDSILYTIFISKQSFSIYHQKTDSIVKIINQHILGIKFYDNQIVQTTGWYLYEILLEPVEDFLTNINKLIIVPDQELSSLPFETLIRSGGEANDYPYYLLIDFDISYQFSTSLWYKNKIYESEKPITLSLLAYAPTFYSEDDGASLKNTTLSPLPYSYDEIKSIEGLFDRENLDVLVLYNEHATKPSFLENVSNYSIIHLATHGIFNKDRPELSGIAFFDNCKSNNNSPFPSTDANLLFVDETYNLLLNAELVVLSACMTGTGKDLKGEGLITLYRGFFYSGAKNIIFTLWNIHDLHSSNFMKTFYNYIFNGNSFVSALKKTKLSFIKNKKTQLPIFWSNYLILGN